MKQQQQSQHNAVGNSDQFERWLISIGKSKKTASHYAVAIRGVISQWAKECGAVGQSLLDINSFIQFQSVSTQIQTFPIFIERNTKGNGMYRAALNAYADYLADVSGDQITAEVQEINEDKTLSKTEKETLISARLGQGKFRQQLIEQWQGCAVTGFRNTRLLVASHIKPWRASNNQERLDPNNGLLLLPNIDKAFDLGFISFENKGNVLISHELEEYEKLGINKKMKFSINHFHEPYMAFHRNIKFKR